MAAAALCVNHSTNNEVGEPPRGEDGYSGEKPIAELRALGVAIAPLRRHRSRRQLAWHKRAGLISLAIQLLPDNGAIAICSRKRPSDAFGLNVGDAASPATTERSPYFERLHEAKPSGADALDRLMGRPADRGEQPLTPTRNAGVHRGIVCREIDADGKRRATTRQPVFVKINLLGLGHIDRTDRPDRPPLLGEPGMIDCLGDAIHRVAAGVGGMIRPPTFPFFGDVMTAPELSVLCVQISLVLDTKNPAYGGYKMMVWLLVMHANQGAVANIFSLMARPASSASMNAVVIMLPAVWTRCGG